VKKSDKYCPNLAVLYLGVKRFCSTEIAALHPDYSGKQVKKKAASMALDVTRYSDAFSIWLQQEEPKAIRLSCHPKSVDTNKIGIYLNNSHCHRTPWHNAAVKVHPSEKYQLMHVEDAHKLDYKRLLERKKG